MYPFQEFSLISRLYLKLHWIDWEKRKGDSPLRFFKSRIAIRNLMNELLQVLSFYSTGSHTGHNIFLSQEIHKNNRQAGKHNIRTN